MRRLKITLGLLVIIIGLGFNYAQIKTALDFSTPQPENEFANLTIPIPPPPTTVKTTSSKSAIRVALLLDTSDSMDGLLEQAKSQLWNILNELARTEKDDGDTKLEIALYEYGNPQKGGRNQINRLSEFTEDMDLISEKLFSLTTNGGQEYCGQIIETSLNELNWGKNPNDLKVIYIAGNEAFTQGPVNFSLACKKAKENDITINTIFCGNYQEGINSSWKTGADISGGIYMHIDHNAQTAYIETPYDDEINKLNQKLNGTYIPYGKDGHSKKQMQSSQDSNAGRYSKTNAADRAVFKSSKKYKAEKWDLVDAYKRDKAVLNKKEELPDTLQNISIEEMEARIQAVINERESIQNDIQELDKKRRLYKAEKLKEGNKNELEKNMLKSIQEQAKKKGFKKSNG